MTLSTKAQDIYSQISQEGTKLGDLRVIAKEIKKDHALAKELWSTGKFLPRLLAILIMDKKKLHPDYIDQLFNDIQGHEYDERTQLADWLMANQLTKDKKTVALIESWENNPSAIKRRIFWYYQGRLRWVGQTPPANTQTLLPAIEEKILKEEPEVQWAMNFTAGWIGVFDQAYRHQCIRIGEETGLYKDEFVHKGCTPNYLPKFIEIEAGKRKL
ncbi:DNA alkylation repair protein [Adhaeribacter sp. BT258]|uniref:DNA alkylation repair protein n=1 Tax=Adhaeribacter terrigena TaxID=2793070 RepID=A0ABS1C570_9BACT|nr:DNA alkylation repair protein [Adhaeribacter terrigena]MBK0403803.1 DNA alkylation repair protein [Adhaeribacter terrigena]